MAQLDALPAAVHKEIARTVDLLGLRMIQMVVRDKLSGQVLSRRTGKLAASIARGAPDTRSRFEQTQTSATSIVGTNVIYGKTWEYGAQIPAYVIRPVKAKALRFTVGGSVVFAQRVNMPARYQQARPFLAPVLAEIKPLAITEITATAKRALEAGLKP